MNKRPAHHDQYQSSSSKESRSEKWPTVFAGNEVIWVDCGHTWLTDVHELILGEEWHCTFNMLSCDTFTVTLVTGTQSVVVGNGNVSIPIASSQPHFALRAQLLVSQCVHLYDVGLCHMQLTRPALFGVSDSDKYLTQRFHLHFVIQNLWCLIICTIVCGGPSKMPE